jgi:hypothetical protein
MYRKALKESNLLDKLAPAWHCLDLRDCSSYSEVAMPLFKYSYVKKGSRPFGTIEAADLPAAFEKVAKMAGEGVEAFEVAEHPSFLAPALPRPEYLRTFDSSLDERS